MYGVTYVHGTLNKKYSLSKAYSASLYSMWSLVQMKKTNEYCLS